MLIYFNYSYCDAPQIWQLGIQDPATPIAEGMLYFHNYLMYYMISIGFFVYWLLYVAFTTNSKKASKFAHSNLLEIIWTIIPAVILVLIAAPSFSLLYSLDELSEPLITVKIVGHQWYWSYEYSDYLKKAEESSTLNFDSYMINSNELTFGSFRLLEVDNRLVLPIKTHIRLLVTSSDVIHSWAIPSFGLKVDGTPGRLSQASLYIKRSGVYYGQCSEICGINHGFMPIVVKAVIPSQFIKWLSFKLG
jgi:cytochrome c oxidase subunit 2